jgi:hypothetical protein
VWQADRVDPWTVGLVAVIVIGLAVIVYGALHDRARNRRAAVEMLAPPRRDIPHFQPDSPPPSYLSELQARRPVEDSVPTELTPDERRELADQLKDPGTLKVGTGYLSRDFVTDRGSGQAVLDAPRVLVCADPVGSLRELLGILEKLVLSRTPLVVVAPALSEEVRSTLEVNQLRHTMRLLAVTPPSGAELQQIADATGADLRSRSDLQAGYVWPEHLGGCARWVSTARSSFVIGGRAPGGTR